MTPLKRYADIDTNEKVTKEEKFEDTFSEDFSTKLYYKIHTQTKAA